MIIGYVGGIGSGKTISMIEQIAKRQPQRSYTNFKLFNVKAYRQLMLNDIITEQDKKWSVNYDYWSEQIREHESFCIYLDELHSIANSRTGMSNINRGINMWTAQIRKILQGMETNNLVFTTQRPMSVDVGVRDLVHHWILCEKIILKKGRLLLVVE